MSQNDKTFTERIEVAGEQLVDTVKAALRDTNAKRVTVRSKEGRELLTIPLTLGIAGATAGVMFVPLIAAAAALGGMMARLTVEIERTGEPTDDHDPSADI
ncbi:MAG: DUF4342 domain-containing protein [Propionibacteriaceae bacterium]|nr:DUF4342 domain-containing protein [Propionibacteriaceae bacterium]